MVDFQSRDTRRGLSGDDDEDEDDEEVVEESADETEDSAAEDSAAEESADESEADEPAADESTEPADSGSDDVDETATESTDATATESTAADPETLEQADDPLAAGPESDDTAAEDPADSTDATVDGEQSAQPGSTGSKAAATPRDESTTQQASNSVQAAVVSIGTAGEDGDPTGDRMVAALERAGHGITARERLRGDFDGVQQSVDALVGRDDVDVVVTAGGTGIRADEIAIEAVHPLLEKALPGFGEAFRTLLFDHVGTGIVAVRTTAGIANSTPVFCLPGDPQAAVLGIEEIVAPEAGELVAHLQSE